MKIAIINRHIRDVIGGSEIQCDNIARGLSDKNHTILYVAPGGNAANDYGTAYKVRPVQSRASSIAQAVAEFKPDIVYWRFNKYFFYNSCKAMAAMSIPVIFAASHINDTKYWSSRDNPKHGLVQTLKSIKQGALNVWNHRGFRYVGGVTVNNPDFLGKITVRKQKFIPNAIETKAVPFDWPKPYILWVSNLKPAKRPELFVDLAKALQDKEVDFLMAGNIQSADYAWIADAGRSVRNFHFLGPKSPEEINGIASSCLFLAHTCSPEGFPNIFLQAWLKSKPVVTLEFDPGKYIESNRLGFNAHGDMKDFVQHVSFLVDHPQAREEMGGNALEFSTRNFSLSGTVDLLESFMKDVIGQ